MTFSLAQELLSVKNYCSHCSQSSLCAKKTALYFSGKITYSKLQKVTLNFKMKMQSGNAPQFPMRNILKVERVKILARKEDTRRLIKACMYTYAYIEAHKPSSYVIEVMNSQEI
jgi:hypothetical protein